MLFPDLLCPVHMGPLVSVEDKPEYKCKCVWKSCGYCVMADDPTDTIIDFRFESGY